MKSVRILAGGYAEEDVYNIDETGLFWRQAPNSGLSTRNIAGVKVDKARVSVVVCTNTTGTDRMPLWIIGKARQPHAFRGVNIHALGVVWRWNKKAWMNGIIMREWITAFYNHVGTRSVLLLMDNFSAHISGIELATPPPNVRIQWLPANSTTRFQPLDQGIIQNLKNHYKKQWLRFIINALSEERNPYKTVTLLNTIRWIAQAWSFDVQNTTIYACFQKSTIISHA